MARLLNLIPKLTNPRPTIELTGCGNLLCYEKCGGRWFRSSESVVESDLMALQELYDTEYFVSVGDLHDSLGITTTMKDLDFGWSKLTHGDITLMDTQMYKDGFMDIQDEPVLVIYPTELPVRDYCG